MSLLKHRMIFLDRLAKPAHQASTYIIFLGYINLWFILH